MAGTLSSSGADDDVLPNLFKGIKYYLIGTVDEKIEKLLNKGGGKRDHYLSEMINYVIVDDVSDLEYSEAKGLFELPCVTTRWVVMSMKCGSLLPTNAFSPETEQAFSGVTVCTSQLSKADMKHIWALVTYNGGYYELAFTNKVTHLITTQCSGSKYVMASRHPNKLHIVSPDWIYDCIADGHVSEALYHPRLLLNEKPVDDSDIAMDVSCGDISGIEPLEDTKDDAKNVKTKEALAAMVSTRIMQSWKAPELEPLPPGPVAASVASPMFPHLGPMPRTPRSMLKNITNSDTPSRPLRGRGSRGPRSPRSPRGRAPTRGPKLSQLVGMGYPGPHQFGTYPQHYPFTPTMGMNIPTPPQPPIYFGFDPLETVPESVCLLGCVFYITDYDKYLHGEMANMLNTWKMVIDQNGGDVDSSYSNRVTHVLCEHQQSDVFQLAVKDGKRVVTAHWLNDVLLKRKMVPPWHALHLPNIYGTEKPCTDQIICVSNYEGDDRTRIKNMITLLGAKYTGYLTSANSLLISKKSEGQKFNKATEWNIPVVNVQWIQDILLGDLSPLKLPVNPKYLKLIVENDKLDLVKVNRLMEGWKAPIRIPKESWKKFNPSKLLKSPSQSNEEQSLKRKADDSLLPGAKKQKLEDEENIAPGSTQPVLLITGIPKTQANQMKAEVIKLGGHVVSTARVCTHLVANHVSRTVKFLTALSVVKYIVTTDWVEQSIKDGKFVDEARYGLLDIKAEEDYQFNLKESLNRAGQKQLFKGFTFFKTPSVLPSGSTLNDIIENAGGVIVARRPSLRHIRETQNDHGQPTFIVITCENDLHLCHDLTNKQIAVHNAEFVLSGVIRQAIDMETYRIN